MLILEADRLRSVSYTHLDVYKRQGAKNTKIKALKKPSYFDETMITDLDKLLTPIELIVPQSLQRGVTLESQSVGLGLNQSHNPEEIEKLNKIQDVDLLSGMKPSENVIEDTKYDISRVSSSPKILASSRPSSAGGINTSENTEYKEAVSNTVPTAHLKKKLSFADYRKKLQK